MIIPVFLLLSTLISCKQEKEEVQQTKKDIQLSPEKKQRIDSQKITYFSTQLELSPEEAQTFWPLYNEYQKKYEDLINQHQEKYNIDPKDFDELTEEEAEKYIDSQINLSKKLTDLRARYHKQYKKILSAKQVLKLYEAEKEFKKILILKAKEKRKNQRQNKRD